MRRLLLSFGAAILLLGGFLLAIGPGRLAEQLVGAHLGVFALGLLAIALALLCWAEASHRLFVAFDPTLSRTRAAVAYGTGAFGKQVLPMGNAGGPAVMAYAFDREVDLGYSRSFAVTGVVEFLSLLASVVLGLVGIAVLSASSPAGSDLRWLVVGVVVLGAALAVLGLVVWYRRRHVGGAVSGIAGLLVPALRRVSPSLAARLNPEQVEATLRRYYETVDAVAANRSAVLYAFVLAQLGWVFFALPLYTAGLALGVRLPLALVLFLVPATGIAAVLPLPGGLGGIEVALAGLLAALAAIDVTTAGAVVILFRLCSFWFMMFVCGIAASMAAVRLRELTGPVDATVVEAQDDGAAPEVEEA